MLNFLSNKNVCVIAEQGINANGDLTKAIQMIAAAKTAGADVVKFQKRNIEKLYRADVLKDPSREAHSLSVYIPILKKCELTEQQHALLKKECDAQKINYLCSAWDIESVDFLETLCVEAHKVPSACLSDIFLMERIRETGKPVIISTGMHTEEEINRVMPLYCQWFKDRMAIMHCVSSYPTANWDVNLKYMQSLGERWGVPVGYSGHERGIPITVAAVAMGARIIERHFTLDRTMKGPDHAASIEPHGLETLVRHLRAVEEAMGDKKYTNQGELLARETLGKALTWARDHAAGETVNATSFCAMSPGYGIPPYMRENFTGKKGRFSLVFPVKAGEKVNEKQMKEAK